MSHEIKLTAAEIEHFTTHGFLSLDRITTAEEVERFRPMYDRVFEGWASKADFTPRDLAGTSDQQAGRVVQMHDISGNVPEFATSIMRRNAESVALQLLGPGTEFRTDHAISKPAGDSAETPWHQDQFYWDPRAEYRRVSVWIPLQDATPENGCMQFVSRQRVGDVIPHHKHNHDPNSHGWEADEKHYQKDWAVPCPIPAGGATIHYGKTLHFTTPNTTDEPRRAYIVSCGVPSTEV